MSYSAYYKRVNRYGSNLQERIQGKKEHDFLTFMSKSPNLVRARNGEDENYYDAVLQTKEYDQDEVTSYLLVPLDKEIPMGTVIHTLDSRHSEERQWINYAIDPYTNTGYNRYTIVELESQLAWVSNGMKYTSLAHATGGGSGAKDKNINLKFNVQFSEAGVYLPNKRYSIIMPTNEGLKKNMKITLEGETWRVAGFDSISVKGVSYVTLEETLTDEKEDVPIANVSQLKNWMVTTNRGNNFTVLRDSTSELELFFFYNNEPREVSYSILSNELYTILEENGRTYLKTTSKTSDNVSLKILIEGWGENEYLEIPFSIKDYMVSSLNAIGPSAVYVGETAKYIIKNANKDSEAKIKYLDLAEIVSADWDEETRDLTIFILGKKIGKNQVIVNDYSFDFEVKSMWLGGNE